MSRLKLVTLSMLAVMAVGVVASASASAANCEQKANGKFALCLGASPGVLTAGNFSTDVTRDGTSVYELKSESGVEVLCSAINSLGGTILGTTTPAVTILGLVLDFSTCTVEAPAKCTVEEKITTESLEGVILKKEEIEFIPTKGEVFAALKFENKGTEICSLKGQSLLVKTVEGKGQGCLAPGIETPAKLHLLECRTAKSHLSLGGSPATFKGNFDANLLSSGGVEETFSVIEGL
jgi:hypothetical protein